MRAEVFSEDSHPCRARILTSPSTALPILSPLSPQPCSIGSLLDFTESQSAHVQPSPGTRPHGISAHRRLDSTPLPSVQMPFLCTLSWNFQSFQHPGIQIPNSLVQQDLMLCLSSFFLLCVRRGDPPVEDWGDWSPQTCGYSFLQLAV